MKKNHKKKEENKTKKNLIQLLHSKIAYPAEKRDQKQGLSQIQYS